MLHVKKTYNIFLKMYGKVFFVTFMHECMLMELPHFQEDSLI